MKKTCLVKSLGATIAEFAIIIPVLLVLIAALIELSHYFIARSVLKAGVEQAANMPAFEDGLNAAGFNGLSNNDAEKRVLERALERAAVNFHTGIVDALTPGTSAPGYIPPTANGKVVTNIQLQIGEENFIGEFNDGDSENVDLNVWMHENPIVITMEASFPSLFSGLGLIEDWKIVVRSAAFRERPQQNSIARLIDCQGNEINADMNVPAFCPCIFAASDPHAYSDNSGQCGCIPPFVPNDSVNPNGLLDEGEICTCPSGTSPAEDSGCACDETICTDAGLLPDPNSPFPSCGCRCPDGLLPNASPVTNLSDCGCNIGGYEPPLFQQGLVEKV
ncbi:MAG: TadE family protein, partial [Bdellovibrionota bacterium]